MALGPVTARLVIVKGRVAAVDQGDSLSCAARADELAAKDRFVGERLTAGTVPVPERLTVYGLALALSAMLSVAMRAPAEGVKVTQIVQLAPAATEFPQLLV